jgi:hypothetical protein
MKVIGFINELGNALTIEYGKIYDVKRYIELSEENKDMVDASNVSKDNKQLFNVQPLTEFVMIDEKAPMFLEVFIGMGFGGLYEL